MLCLTTPVISDSTIDNVLEYSQKLLEIGEEVADLSPIPGLGIAAKSLSAIIEHIKQARGNVETREDIAKQIQSLSKAIEQAQKQSSDIVRKEPEKRKAVGEKFRMSTDLVQRVEKLNQILSEANKESEKLGKKNTFLRYLRSDNDADTLSGLQARIKSAIDTFVVASQVAIEKVAKDAAGIIVGIRDKVEMMKETLVEDYDGTALLTLTKVEADYRAEHNKTKSYYLEGTRTAILQDLEEWAKSNVDQAEHAIYVLSGGPGSGKSTIAYEFAKRLEKEKILGATFFFVRGDEKLSTTRFVLPTIAYQLASNHSDLRPYVAEAVREHNRQGQRQHMEFQIEDLLIQPLKEVPSDHTPIVVIIDAIDECSVATRDEMSRMLYLLMDKIQDVHLPFRVLITTRPEQYIESALQSYDFSDAERPFKLIQMPEAEVADSDISQYLEKRLIAFEYKKEFVSKRPEAKEDLLRTSQGLFIYAPVAANFIFAAGTHYDDAVRKLDIVLASASVSGPGDNLDKLYVKLLQHAFPQSLLQQAGFPTSLKDVLGAIALLQDYVSAKTLEALAGVTTDKTLRIMKRLGNLVVASENPDSEVTLKPFHASFSQFLVNRERCTDDTFLVEPSSFHCRLAVSCLKLLSAPHGLRSSTNGLSPQLQYSCVHWPAHLLLASPTSELRGSLNTLLQEDLLLWFEALSSLNRLDVAASMLPQMEAWYQSHYDEDPPDTPQAVDLLNDGYRFIMEYFEPIRVDPKQIYISALPLTPSCTLLDVYGKRYSDMSSVQVLAGRDDQWGGCLRTIEGHTQRVTSAKFSPDGVYIVSGAWDRTVRTWDAATGMPLRVMKRHGDGVEDVAFSPDPKLRRIVSASSDTTLCIWDFASGAPLHRMRTHKGNVFTVAFSPDGQRVLSGSYGKSLQLWDAHTGKCLGEHGVAVSSIALSLDGSFVVTGSGGAVHVWDGHSGRYIKALEGHKDQVADVACTVDSKRAVSGSYDMTVRVWNIRSGTIKKTLKGHTARIFSVAASAKYIASGAGDDDPTIRLWDADTYELTAIFKDHTDSIYSLDFSPDNQRLVSASNDCTVRLWDLSVEGGSESVGHSSGVNCVVFSEDRTWVATASSDNTIRIWETATGKCLHVLDDHTDRVTSVAFSPNGQVISGGWDGELKIWDVREGKLLQSLQGHPASIEAVACSPNGKWYASASTPNDPVIRLWRTEDYAAEKTIPFDFGRLPVDSSSEEPPSDSDSGGSSADFDPSMPLIDYVSLLEFSPDSSRIHATTVNGLSYVWEISTNKVLGTKPSWETARQQDSFKEEDGWIRRISDNKRLCWIPKSRRALTEDGRACSRGSFYALGAGSGRVTILDLSELL